MEFEMPEIIPYHAQWDVTSGCNFRCVFCLTSSGKPTLGELSTDEAINLIDNLYDEGIWFLKIMGGEPFYRKDILTLLRYATSKGMVISFSTNASLITPEIAESLAEINNSILYIQMSLYGENGDTYKRVTGSENNFKRAMNGLDLLIKNNLDVTILTVVTENNAHKIIEYYNIAKNHGAKEFRLTQEICLGRSAEKSNHKKNEYHKIWANFINSLHNIKNSMSITDPPLLLDARPLFGSFLYNLTGFYTFFEKCSAATTMLYIDPTGKILPCPFLRQMPTELQTLYSHIQSEDIHKKKLQEIWNSQSFETFRSYYNPKNNLFKINQSCKYFKDRTCIPCAVTPCNCPEMIKFIKEEINFKESEIQQLESYENIHFKVC